MDGTNENSVFSVNTLGQVFATTLQVSGESKLAQWSVDSDAIYFGTKQTTGLAYSAANSMTFGVFDLGGGDKRPYISAPNFLLDRNGDATFRGTVFASAGNFINTVSIGSDTTNGTLSVGRTGSDKIIITGQDTSANTKIYTGSGPGAYNNANNKFYVDASGRFSLGEQVTWNGTDALTVQGVINAIGGNFVNTVTVGASADKISIKGGAVGSAANETKIYSGTGTFGQANTGFYLDSGGDFSLGNKLTWDNSSSLLSIEGDIGGTIGQIAVGNRVRITQDGLFGLESNGAAINTSSNNFRLSALDGGIYAKFGQIASWNIDADSIYVGTKTANENFSSAGHVTLGSDGHISANQFRIDTNGNAFFKGDLTAATGTFGSPSSGHVILGNSTNPLQVKNSTTSLMNLSSGGVLTVAGFTAASSALYTGTKSSFASNNAGVYVAPDGIALGTNSPFKVTSSGVLTANSGLIAGFTIDTRDFIGSYTPTVVTSTSTVTIGTGSKTFSFSTTTTNWRVGDYIYARGSTNARRMWGNITSLSTTSVTINVLTTLSTGVTESSWTLGFLYNYTASITPANMQIKAAGLSGFFTSSNPFINLGLVNSDPNPDPQQLTQYSGPSLDISESGATIVRGNTTQVSHTARFKANALEFWGGSALDNEIMIHNWGQGMLTMASYGPLSLKAGFNGGTGDSARIYVSRPDYASTVLRNPNGTGGFDGATEVSSKIVKENFKEINQEDLKTFLDKVEMKKFNYKENKYQIGYSFVLEDEIEKNTPFINEITYSINGTTIFEEKELPDYLRPYLGTGYLKQREDGKYEYSSLEYRSSALAGITLAATQLNHNRIKELEEENKKLKDEIALIKEKLGM
jgi:hypothetical protein